MCLNLPITFSCPCLEQHKETVQKAYPLQNWTTSIKIWAWWLLWTVPAQGWSFRTIWKEVGRFGGKSEIGAIRHFISRGGSTCLTIFLSVFNNENVYTWASKFFFFFPGENINEKDALSGKFYAKTTPTSCGENSSNKPTNESIEKGKSLRIHKKGFFFPFFFFGGGGHFP